MKKMKKMKKIRILKKKIKKKNTHIDINNLYIKELEETLSTMSNKLYFVQNKVSFYLENRNKNFTFKDANTLNDDDVFEAIIEFINKNDPDESKYICEDIMDYINL